VSVFVVLRRHALRNREEVTFVAFDVVLLGVGCGQFETHPVAVVGGDDKSVIGESVSGLDVVLVAVGPVQQHFLAVVGNSVLVSAGVTAIGHEVDPGRSSGKRKCR